MTLSGEARARAAAPDWPEEADCRSRIPLPLTTVFCLTIILIAGIVLRFVYITDRPLHPDEGVNFHFVNEILKLGYYKYSHENYHGPLYHYLNALSVYLAGESELSLRLSSILLGCVVVIVPLFFRRTIGDTTAALSSVLLAFSPSLVFHSRYAIHEMSFVLWQLILALLLFRWTTVEHRSKADAELIWYPIALMIVFLVATKETFVISLFWLSLAALCSYGSIQMLRNRVIAQRQTIYRALILSFVMVAGLFTAGFRRPQGFFELCIGLQQWLMRGTVSDPDHFKNAAYYLQKLVMVHEPQAVIIPLLGLLLLRTALFSKNDRTGGRYSLFLAVWACGTAMTYSLIPYKTPWLVINLTLPLLLLAAAILSRLFAEIPHTITKLGAITVLLLASLTQAINVSFKNVTIFGQHYALLGYGPQNPFAYGHTSEGLLELVKDIEQYRAKSGGKVFVAVPLYWPLPYYLRQHAKDVFYFPTSNPQQYDQNYPVIVAHNTSSWAPPDYQRKYYKLSEVQQSIVYFRKELAP